MSIHQRRKASIENLAESLLRENNSFVPGFKLRTLAEKLGVRLIEEEMESNISGYSAIKDKQKVIAINTSQSKPRQRFTIAHELGHLFLHDFNEFNFNQDQKTFYRNNVSSSGMDSFEIEANYFAACLLMPKSLIEESLAEASKSTMVDESTLEDLASKFNVSIQAMSIRLSTLGIIGF